MAKFDSPDSTPFRVPFILSLIATPIALLLAFFSAGAGHGDYFLAKLLFPFTMLSTALLNEITLPFFLFGLLQFSVYGAVLGVANRKGRLRRAMICLSVIHIVAVVACFILIGENFS